tara:strand:+ start:622 stop:2028 length:1407 start_codon:yes stop_codon:yes gene_type:complete
MLKKNNYFFKKLEKYKKNNALILENYKYISYNELLLISKRISKKIQKKKKLIFLLGQNNLESIAGYISFVNKGHSVALLDFRINEMLLKRLTSIYKPSYIFCDKKKIKNKNLYSSVLKYKTYVLLKRKKDEKSILNKDLMLLMSTSGTTGSPKFVRQSYSNVLSNTKNIIKYLKIKSKDITITSLPLTYVYGLSVINTHLFAGATVVLTNYSMVEKKFWNLINDCKVTNFSGVPYNYSIIEKISKKGLPSSLEYTTQAGGKMNHLLIKNIINIYKKNKIKLIQMYGASEATSRMSYLKWKYADRKIGSIGKPIPEGIFYLIDKNGNKIKKKNKRGELVYLGKNVCMGYAENLKGLSLPDLNKGLLKTGDIAYEDKDGFYYITGRKNRYIKIYGIRVNLSELESLLFKKGIDVIMKESNENKIIAYFKNPSKTKEGIKYISKITSISSNVFVTKTISKKNLTNNFKYKL